MGLVDITRKLYYAINQNALILIIFIIAAMLRLARINSIGYTDELVFFWAVRNAGFFNYFFPIYGGVFIWTHPIISPLMYWISGFLFGYSTISMRLVPFIFSLLNLFMVYKLTKKFYDKKTALIAVIIMTFSIWHIIGSNLVEHDASILTFLYLTTFYVFLLFEKTNKIKWLIMTGISFGLALLVKYSAAFIGIILGGYVLIVNGKKIKQSIQTLFPIYLIAAVMIGSFMIITYLISPAYLFQTLRHASNKLTVPSPRVFIYLIFWASPLLFATAFFSIFQIRKDKKLILFYLWYIIPFFIYVFASPIIAFERHLTVTIPAMIILSAIFIRKIKFEKIHIILGSAFGFFIFILMYLLNLQTKYIEHNLDNFITHALQFHWNFYFPLTGAAGPLFGISFISLMISVLISLLAYLIAFVAFFKNKAKLFTVFFTLFLAVGFAYNIFLDYEYTTKSIHPDYSKIAYEIIDDYHQNYEGKYIYTNMYGMTLYLNKTADELYLFGYGTTFTVEQENELLNSLKTNSDYVVLIVDFPVMKKEGRVWEQLNTCQKNTFYSNEKPAGYVFYCE